MKKIIMILSLICLTFVTSGYTAGYRPDITTIEAVKNSNHHNNMGTYYMREKTYYAAIQEFKIAISLNPESQATAVYYTNLGECYMKIGYPQLALDCYERALKIYNLNLNYYINYAKCIIANGKTEEKLTQFKDFSNPYNRLMSGVLYVEKGNYPDGITILDGFTIEEPDLIITPAIKNYIKTSVKNMNSEPILPEGLTDL